jgi:xanthine dehydrogenase iron-sulfur cluster and FAD-binding subunit A
VPDATDLSSDLAQQAVEPASSSGDGHSASARPIGDLLKAQQALDARVTVRKRRRGMITTQLTTPGALDDAGRSTTGGFGGGIT